MAEPFGDGGRAERSRCAASLGLLEGGRDLSRQPFLPAGAGPASRVGGAGLTGTIYRPYLAVELVRDAEYVPPRRLDGAASTPSDALGRDLSHLGLMGSLDTAADAQVTGRRQGRDAERNQPSVKFAAVIVGSRACTARLQPRSPPTARGAVAVGPAIGFTLPSTGRPDRLTTGFRFGRYLNLRCR